MIKHIVFWKINEDLDKAVVLPKMKEQLLSLQGKIEGLKSMEIGYNFNNGDFDIALYSVFESKEALEVYANHPSHLVVKKFVHSVIINRASVDYEI